MVPVKVLVIAAVRVSLFVLLSHQKFIERPKVLNLKPSFWLHLLILDIDYCIPDNGFGLYHRLSK